MPFPVECIAGSGEPDDPPDGKVQTRPPGTKDAPERRKRETGKSVSRIIDEMVAGD